MSRSPYGRHPRPRCPGRRAPPTLEMGSFLDRRHLAEVDPLQSREIGSSVAVRAKFESSSDQFRKAPCFVMFRGARGGPVGGRSPITGGIQRARSMSAPLVRAATRHAVPRAKAKMGDRDPAAHLAGPRRSLPSSAPRFLGGSQISRRLPDLNRQNARTPERQKREKGECGFSRRMTAA